MPVGERGGAAIVAELTDAEAVARCRAGDEGPGHAAFRVLYERHEPDVLRFLAQVLGRDAQAVDDATQETFVRLYRSLKGYDAARPLRPYVLSIARNVALDALHARRKTLPLEVLERERVRGPRGGALESAARNERASAIDDALAALAPEHRSLIALRWVHELKQEEIAEALGCTARTVRNRLRIASMLLERELVRRGVTPEDEEVVP